MTAPFTWEKLIKLEDSIAWRRDLENAPLSHVWHLETVADLATEIRRRMTVQEADERLIGMLWARVSDEAREEVRGALLHGDHTVTDAAFRLGEIVGLPD